MVNATKESFDEDDLAKFQELLLDAKKPLYKGCHDFTKLSAIVKLLNLKGKYGASDKFFTELLGLSKKMLRAEIAKDLRNLRLGISTDGVDVNSGTRHHSVWPVLSILYNLPPWLWIDTYDTSTKENFNLRAVMLWTINDYPALGTLCGCPYSGFNMGKIHIVLDFLPHPSKVMMDTDDIYHTTIRSEGKKRRLMDNKNFIWLQIH
nr:hypothetical protein [Tanacetum cinerariifolium]